MKRSYTLVALAALLITMNLPAALPRAVPDSARKSSTVLKREKDENSFHIKNVVKMNLSQLGITNLSFQYELAFHKNMSIGCGFSYLVPKPLPGFFVDKDPTGEGLRNTEYKGFAITPEFRVYPGKKVKHQAPHGFYFAGYVRYARYSFSSSYYETYNNETYGYNLTSTYGGYTGGLMVGYQWIIAKHLSIDFWIAGAGFGNAKLSLKADLQGIAIPPDEQEHIKQSLSDELAKVNYIHASDPVVTTTDHSVDASISRMPMLSVRGLGFCIGFAF